MTTERETDVYFKKTIPFNFSKQRLRFRVSQDLFSSHDVDVGSRFLLRTLVTAKDVGRPSSILDLGCGYGPIGLTLKQLHPEAVVHLTDRDALAVEYARQNAVLNGFLDGVEVYGSLGYDDLRRTAFHLIVSNIPGKAGQAVVADLLLGAGRRLDPGGLVAVVVVAPLESFVAGVLGGRGDVDIVLHERKSGHAVFHYRFTGAPSGAPAARSAFERGVYRRQVASVTKANLSYSLETAFNLPEFDSPSYATEMLFDGLRDLCGDAVERAVLFNPGQGHAAVALWKWLEPRQISLVDRDLLALRYARLNLLRNGCPEDRVALLHQVGVRLPQPESVDLTLGVLREDEGQEAVVLTVRQAAEQLAPGGRALVAGSSTAITRLATFLDAVPLVEVVDRKRRAGHSLLVLRKP
jgi:16S rRNA (guanine1207-N2)-methyltransferase